MAIDPSISLAYKPVEVPDPLQVRAQQLGLQNLVAQQRLIPGQQQIQQQTIQANQLAIQQQQRDLNDQQMMTKALIQSKPGDLDDIAKNALQLGVSPKGLLAFQTQFSELARNRAMLSDEELKSQGAREQALTETAGSLLELPDVAARQAQWPNARANLILNWQMKPEQIPEQYPGDEWLNANYKVTAMGAAATMRALAMQQLASARSTALGNVKLGPGQVLVRPDASAAAPGPPLGQAPTPPQASMIGQGAVVPPQGGAIAPPTNFTPIQQTAPTSQAPGAPATGMVPPAPATGATVTPGVHVVASNPAPVRAPASKVIQRTEADGKVHNVMVDSAGKDIADMGVGRQPTAPVVNVTMPGLGPHETAANAGLTGDAYLAALPPATAAQIRAVAEGRAVMPPPSRYVRPGAPLSPADQIRAGVFQYDPDYSDQRAQIRKSLMTGTESKTIGNNNTAIVHMDQLEDIAKSLDNGTLQPGNALWNSFVNTFGAAPPTNYEGLRQALAGEMDQALHGTSTIEGRQAVAATIPAKLAPGQMAGIIHTDMQTLATKLATYQQRYQALVPGDKYWSPVLPQARAVMLKNGFDPNAVQSQHQQGGAPKFKVGDPVMYQGKSHKVTAVDPQTGKLTLEP